MIRFTAKNFLVICLCTTVALPFSAESATPIQSFGSGPTQTKDPTMRQMAPPLFNNANEYASNFNPSSLGTTSAPTNAISSQLDPEGKTSPVKRGREYISGNYEGAVLIPVQLMGAVGQAGVHHVPTGTDLMQLMTLAGGPTPDGKLDEITLKRWDGKSYETIKIDLEAFFEESSGKSPELFPNDIIMVPAEKPFFDQDTLTAVSVLASVVGIVASSILIVQQLK